MSFSFNNHDNLEGTHAILSASQHYWLSYSDDRMRDYFYSTLAKQRGTEMHAFAEQANKLGIKMPRNHITINEFINDGLGYNMRSEVLLYFSPIAYGTADLIGFDEKKKILRIFDLKTGKKDVLEFGQLHIYAALFCLEYNKNPEELTFDFRLYQNDLIRIEEDPDSSEIREIMDKIIHFTELIQDMRTEAKDNRYVY